MKKILSLVILAALFTTPAFAGNAKSHVPFSNISAADAAVKTSSAVYVGGYNKKTLQVSGVTLGSSLTSITYKNMSGTILAQCAPASTGPWATCASESAQTAASRTTNGVFSWSDAAAYIRLHWTSGTVGGKLKAWLNLNE